MEFLISFYGFVTTYFSMIESEETLLSIILDLNLDSWILLEKSNKGFSIVFEEFLNSFLSFVTSFLLQNHHNQLVVSVYGNGEPTIIFPVFKGDIAQNIVAHSQQINVVFSHLNQTILKMMKQNLNSNCHLDACLSRTLCFLNKYASKNIKKRFLIFNASQTPIKSYMNFMNSIFTYKTSCPIDICQLNNLPCEFLKRASSLTNGIYIRCLSTKSLYGLLSYYFLPDASIRKNMVIPQDLIDTYVPCACHGKPIPKEQVYICPVCLSVLCKKYDKCPIHEIK